MQPAARRQRLWTLGLAFGGLIAAVLAVVTIVWINIGLIKKAAAEVGEAKGELAWADAVLDAASDQQNAFEGLIATHDPRYVAPYEVGQARFKHAFEQLSASSADDTTAQRREVANVGQFERNWIAVAGPHVAAAKTGRVLAPPAPGGLDGMKQVRRAVEYLRDVELKTLAQRQRLLDGAYGATRRAMVVGSSAALAFVLVILGLAARQLINERRRAEDAARRLGDALERAQAAERTKARFLANMSHEMRTPLNGVSGMTEALAHTKLDPLQSELVEAIRFSSATLDHLIGDLLTVSNGGVAAVVEHQTTKFHFGAAIRATALPFSIEAEAKGLAFGVAIDPAADVRVTGDPGSVGELLTCLLSNALKFTERGQVGVSARRVGEGVFSVEVSDTGVGFDEAHVAAMFETFNQEDDSDTRRFGGAGLGLSVARRLAAELGGRLEAHSTPGEGSVFSFEIEMPVASDEIGAGQSADTACADEPHEVMRALIVDDNSTNRKVLELILDQLGVEWVSVEDGHLAVEAACEQAFTVILMDIQMPVMDGLTATREIRRIERETGRPAVPVIIVSASCQSEHVEAGRTAGAQRHLGKPVSPQALIEALHDVLADTAQAA